MASGCAGACEPYLSIPAELIRVKLIFLLSVQTSASDEFTGRLMQIYRKSISSPRQRAVLGLHRSDYMLHDVEGDPRTVLQVELNTISSSFGGLSRQVTFVCLDLWEVCS